MNFSPLELLVVVIVVVLLFGVKRLPELGSGMGLAINNFKKSFKEGATMNAGINGDTEVKSPKVVEDKTGSNEN